MMEVNARQGFRSTEWNILVSGAAMHSCREPAARQRRYFLSLGPGSAVAPSGYRGQRRNLWRGKVLLRGLAVPQSCIQLVDELFGGVGNDGARREDRFRTGLIE